MEVIIKADTLPRDVEFELLTPDTPRSSHLKYKAHGSEEIYVVPNMSYNRPTAASIDILEYYCSTDRSPDNFHHVKGRLLVERARGYLRLAEDPETPPELVREAHHYLYEVLDGALRVPGSTHYYKPSSDDRFPVNYRGNAIFSPEMQRLQDALDKSPASTYQINKGREWRDMRLCIYDLVTDHLPTVESLAHEEYVLALRNEFITNLSDFEQTYQGHGWRVAIEPSPMEKTPGAKAKL